jgi:cytochrome c oxidase subunit 2
MHIHRLEKFWIGVSFILIFGFIGTVIVGFTVFDLKVIGKSETIDPTKLQETEFANPGVRAVTKGGQTHYEAYIVARQFLYMPGTGTPIKVPTDSKVTFYITSPDVLHGFQVVGTNLNTMVIPGQVTKMSTRFDNPGTYGILCNEYCGAAHHAMEGRLEVVAQSEFNTSE